MNWILEEGNYFKKAVLTICIGVIPVVMMTLDMWDFCKDASLAAYLYFERWAYIHFVSIKGLIMFYGLSVVASSITMCWMIQFTKNNGIINLNKIKKGLIRRLVHVLLFVLTPVIPMSLLLKSVRLWMKILVRVAKWRNNRRTEESPSAAWMKINALELKTKNVDFIADEVEELPGKSAGQRPALHSSMFLLHWKSSAKLRPRPRV